MIKISEDYYLEINPDYPAHWDLRHSGCDPAYNLIDWAGEGFLGASKCQTCGVVPSKEDMDKANFILKTIRLT